MVQDILLLATRNEHNIELKDDNDDNEYIRYVKVDISGIV